MSTTYDKYPDPGALLQFNNFKKTTKVPFTFIFDFESFLKPIDESKCKAIKHIQEHIPSAFAQHCISRVSDYQPKPIVRVKTKPEENLVIKFLDALKKWTYEIYERFKDKKPLALTSEEEYLYQKLEKCWKCGKPFYYEKDWKEWKVRDHNHFTGEFRGAAHNKCNLRIQNRIVIPVIAHNLSKYDLKLFIRDPMKYIDGKPDVIAKSSEEFIAVSIKVEVNSKAKKDGNMKHYYHTLRFIDSLKFLSAPLDKLVESRKSGCTDLSENFPILKNYFP